MRFGNEKLFQLSVFFLNSLNDFLESLGLKPIQYRFFDESFTTIFANQYLHAYNFSHPAKQKAQDKLAATTILQEALNDMEFI